MVDGLIPETLTKPNLDRKRNVHPYILTHEADIENLMSTGHEELKRVGIICLRRLWAYLQRLGPDNKDER